MSTRDDVRQEKRGKREEGRGGFETRGTRDEGQEMREKRDKRWDEGKRVLVTVHYR
jgi:hypothetical protein